MDKHKRRINLGGEETLSAKGQKGLFLFIQGVVQNRGKRITLEGRRATLGEGKGAGLATTSKSKKKKKSVEGERRKKKD